MTFMQERAFHAMPNGELNDIITEGDLVPAIRAYLVFMGRNSSAGVLPFNAQYLLREAAAKLESI